MGENVAGRDATGGETDDPDSSRPPPLVAWAFAAFHAALLVALAVGVLYFAGLAGDQLDALGTSAGVVAYCYFWAVTWWTNRRMVGAVGWGLVTGSASPTDVLGEAMKWGAATGLLVFLPVLLIGVVLFVGAGGLEAVPFLLVAGAIGTVVAAGVGVGIGAAFALFDLLLARLARVWLPSDGDSRSPGTQS